LGEIVCTNSERILVSAERQDIDFMRELPQIWLGDVDSELGCVEIKLANY